jgi:5-methyltetrahydrofolate--homocysteine methyltransferase
MDVFNKLSITLQQGYVDETKNIINNALGEGYEAEELLHKGLLAAMKIIGEKFRKDEIFIPEVLISARAMNAALKILKEELVRSDYEAEGTAVIGTVEGDIHNIGKNIVKIMLEGRGFEVYDLGTDVSPEEFAEAVKKYKPDLLGISALLTTTMSVMEDVIGKIKSENLREGLIIMIGGAPITDNFCKNIDADIYAANAADAADMAEEMLKRK